MSRFSFIFAGTAEPALSVLKILAQNKSLKLKGLVSRPDSFSGRGMKKRESPIKSFARAQGLPVWTPKKANEPGFLGEVSKIKADFSFVCSYGQILPPAYLQIFPKACLNLHFSLLPRWRGAAPIQRALMAGDSKTGLSLQKMTDKLDAGDIIAQAEFEIEEGDSAKDLFNKALRESRPLLMEKLTKYLKGELKACPQGREGAAYAKKIDKKEAEIDWREPALKIHNKIRALYLGPQAFSRLKGKRLKIYRAKAIKKSFPGFAPGEVCLAGEDELALACGKGALSLLELKKEGKNIQHIKEFLKGCPLRLKSRLG